MHRLRQLPHLVGGVADIRRWAAWFRHGRVAGRGSAPRGGPGRASTSGSSSNSRARLRQQRAAEWRRAAPRRRTGCRCGGRAAAPMPSSATTSSNAERRRRRACTAAVTQVAAHVQVREQARVLEHVADARGACGGQVDAALAVEQARGRRSRCGRWRGVTSPAMACSTVVLPAPEGPLSAITRAASSMRTWRLEVAAAAGCDVERTASALPRCARRAPHQPFRQPAAPAARSPIDHDRQPPDRRLRRPAPAAGRRSPRTASAFRRECWRRR